jgi:hypothetical protein
MDILPIQSDIVAAQPICDIGQQLAARVWTDTAAGLG